jgi:predicted Fe-Mo cluster-binding NifX family protein
LAGFLRAAEVEVLICGGIGMGARNFLNEVGIKLLPGVTGKADEVIKDYIEGHLDYDPDTECHHHDHEGGHNCHSGSCETHKCH